MHEKATNSKTNAKICLRPYPLLLIDLVHGDFIALVKSPPEAVSAGCPQSANMPCTAHRKPSKQPYLRKEGVETQNELPVAFEERFDAPDNPLSVYPAQQPQFAPSRISTLHQEPAKHSHTLYVTLYCTMRVRAGFRAKAGTHKHTQQGPVKTCPMGCNSFVQHLQTLFSHMNYRIQYTIDQQGSYSNTTLSALATQGPGHRQEWAVNLPLRLELFHDLQEFIVYFLVVLELDLDVAQIG